MLQNPKENDQCYQKEASFGRAQRDSAVTLHMRDDQQSTNEDLV